MSTTKRLFNLTKSYCGPNEVRSGCITFTFRQETKGVNKQYNEEVTDRGLRSARNWKRGTMVPRGLSSSRRATRLTGGRVLSRATASPGRCRRCSLDAVGEAVSPLVSCPHSVVPAVLQTQQAAVSKGGRLLWTPTSDSWHGTGWRVDPKGTRGLSRLGRRKA